MTKQIKITIDNQSIKVPAGIKIIQACQLAEIEIPKFCYHSRLSVSGNCRMCLVEIDGIDKPVTSCTTKVEAGMIIRTASQKVKDARADIMEFLLANHPLDCPTCDQAGECDLQDFSIQYGADKGNFDFTKKIVENPDLGPYIQTFMNRCIYCMKCVRFSEEISDKHEFGALFKGEKMAISNTKVEISSQLSGNVIDLCPVGALTSKVAKYKFRPWELISYKSNDVLDPLLPNVYFDVKDNKIVRVRGRDDDGINQGWISNLTRFSYDGLYRNRIKTPMFKAKPCSWRTAFDELLELLQEINPKNISAIISDSLNLEDLQSFKNFYTQTIGAKHIGLNQTINLKEFNKSNVIFSDSIDNLNKYDTVILVGTDLQYQLPLLQAKIINAKLNVIKVDTLINFDKNLIKNKKTFVIADVKTIVERKDAADIINYLDSLKTQFDLSLNFLAQSSGLINAVEVFDKFTNIHKKLEQNKVDLLFVYGSCDIPNNLIKNAKNIVYIGTHNNKISESADLVLPTSTYTEKNGLWNNIYGEKVEVKAVTKSYEQSREDWKIWKTLSEYISGINEFDEIEILRGQIKCNKTQNYKVDKKATSLNKKMLENNFKSCIKMYNEISLNSEYYKG